MSNSNFKQKLLFSAIENSLEADLYTIVDWHILKDENKISWINWSLSDKDKSYSFFKPNNKKCVIEIKKI